MATLKEIREAFFALDKKEQSLMLKEIYGFSKDMKNFLNNRLLSQGEEAYLEQIRKVTESSTSTGYPKNIKVTEVNKVISSAKKAKVSKDIMCEMQWIAFDGYMTFLNDYGGGPDSYESKVHEHLENYLNLLLSMEYDVKDELDGVISYLKSHTNMYHDHIWELFTDMTGLDL